MPNPPTEKGIMNAMKSMQNIAKNGDFKTSTVGMPATFPRPPIEFVGNIPKKKKVNTPKKSNSTVVSPTKKKTNKKQPLGPNQSSTSDPVLRTSSKADTNSQLFGTLVNSLKTCPAGQVGKVEKKRPTEKSKVPKKTSKSYSSSSSSSSASSSSSSTLSMSSASSPSTNSLSSAPSSSSRHTTSSKSSSATTGKLAREKKKRKEELLHEKIEMLTRIINLTKNGFTPTRKWDVKDDIDEIRYECYRMQRESNAKKAIKVMRRVLVTITTLVETGNSYFNPFNLRLEGFSESMMLNLDDYDDCFEQIHHKYSGRSSVGPEMQILFTFMSAAIFHHAGNAIGGGRDGPTKKKPSASPMSSVMSMMGMFSNSNKKPPSSTNYPRPRMSTASSPLGSNVQDSSHTESSDKPKRKIMRGPGASSIPTSIFGAQGGSGDGIRTAPSMTLPSMS